MTGSSLEALQRAIHRAVKEEAPVEEVAAELGVDPRRLDIYRGMVRGHVSTALKANFEVSQGVLGEALFGALYEAYLAECPPASWSLNHAAASFPDFLEGVQADGRPGLRPFHVCLADVEWALYETQIHPARVPEPQGEAVLNPTLAVVATPYPVVPFMVAWHRGEGPAEPEPAESINLLFQRPGTGVAAYHHGADDLLFALKVTHDGLTPTEAAEAAGQPLELVEAVLARAASVGLVIPAG